LLKPSFQTRRHIVACRNAAELALFPVTILVSRANHAQFFGIPRRNNLQAKLDGSNLQGAGGAAD
jgi:hypothetical protein